MRFLFSVAISIFLLAVVIGTAAFLYFSSSQLRARFIDDPAKTQQRS